MKQMDQFNKRPAFWIAFRLPHCDRREVVEFQLLLLQGGPGWTLVGFTMRIFNGMEEFRSEKHGIYQGKMVI